jgi:hypothetical protein
MKIGPLSPSPLWGEGWGEGWISDQSVYPRLTNSFPLPSSGGFFSPPNLDIDQLQISTLSVAFTACCVFKFVQVYM